jgi:DNA invertase Pin-like site-specific DNA recombinase
MTSPTDATARSTIAGLPGSKIARRHQERLAVVYVRQSTMQQTVRHQESTRMQYGLIDRALGLGWSRDRILVIDDDLGRSGASAEGRPGFQRLVAKVGLDHVGIILGVEISRLARSCRDWHQLLEVCAVFGTLISDLDGIYDPSHYNDRLLLGLKGTMSEAELHVLKQRMLEGKLAKARRGELGMRVAMGYVRRPSGETIKDPDEQVQSVIGIIFDQFEARGTIDGVLCYLVDHGLRLPVRVASGENKGDLEWHRPNRVSISNLLHNPLYAGAYVYGRRPTDPRRKIPGRSQTGRTVAAFGEWRVLIKDRLPAYISWEIYERNVRQMEANTTRVMGTPRRGVLLLSGLIECGRCGHRMATQYSGGYSRYVCSRQRVDYAEPMCQSFAGRTLDEKMTELVLNALQPAALDVSLRVAEDIESERRRLESDWCKRLERATYEVNRARRQYDAVEPENRLVARGLERQLEDKLSAEQSIVEAHDRFVAERPTVLTAEEREMIRMLAADIPALWSAATTMPEERKTILRQLVDRVIVTVNGDSEHVAVEVLWVGGHRTKTGIIRPVGRLQQLSYYAPLVDRIQALHAEGLPRDGIAQRLNDEKWRPPKRRPTFNAQMVGELLARNQKATPRRRQPLVQARLKSHEWRLADLAAELSMPSVTLYTWVMRDWVKGRRLDEPRRPWALFADAQELARLRALRQAPKLGWRAQTDKLLARG